MKAHDQPYPNSHWENRSVSFDAIIDGLPRRLVGLVERAKYIGLTERGQIPDWALSIRGASGALLVASLVNSYASFDPAP